MGPQVTVQRRFETEVRNLPASHVRIARIDHVVGLFEKHGNLGRRILLVVVVAGLAFLRRRRRFVVCCFV
jgi:hypothetical protein